MCAVYLVLYELQSVLWANHMILVLMLVCVHMLVLLLALALSPLMSRSCCSLRGRAARRGQLCLYRDLYRKWLYSAV